MFYLLCSNEFQRAIYNTGYLRQPGSFCRDTFLSFSFRYSGTETGICNVMLNSRYEKNVSRLGQRSVLIITNKHGNYSEIEIIIDQNYNGAF